MSIADANIQEDWKKDMERTDRRLVRQWLKEDGTFEVEEGEFLRPSDGNFIVSVDDAPKDGYVIGAVCMFKDVEKYKDILVVEAWKRGLLSVKKNDGKKTERPCLLVKDVANGKFSFMQIPESWYVDGASCAFATYSRPSYYEFWGCCGEGKKEEFAETVRKSIIRMRKDEIVRDYEGKAQECAEKQTDDEFSKIDGKDGHE